MTIVLANWRKALATAVVFAAIGTVSIAAATGTVNGHVNAYDDQGVFLVSGTAILLEGGTATIVLEIAP